MKSNKEDSEPRRLTLSGPDFSLLVQALIEKNAAVKFKVTGKSMYPNIRSGDVITLVPCAERTPEPGDVVGLLDSKNRQIIVHRIIKKNDGRFLVKGDNVIRSDGYYPRDKIIGVLTELERNREKKQITGPANKIDLILSKIRFFSLSKFIFFFKKL